MILQAPLFRFALLTATFLVVPGCGGPRIPAADREHAIKEREEQIEMFKKDRTMNPTTRSDLIEKLELEIKELKEPAPTR